VTPSGRPVDDHPDHLLDLAREIAVDAARLIAEGRRGGVSDVQTKSTSTDMVTEYDRLSEQLIVDRLLAARPNDGLIGEEGAARRGSSGIDWLIDPIDGTTNFLYGLPGYAVSIAATDGLGGLLGVVVIPATGEVFAARRDGGATCNGEPIRCSPTTDVARALVATGFSYDAQRRAHQGARVAALLPQIRDIRRLGAAAADLCHTAAGRLDAYFEEHLQPWDLAAGEVIAREAGCRIGPLDPTAAEAGAPLHHGVLVAPPALFDALRRLIVECDRALGS